MMSLLLHGTLVRALIHIKLAREKILVMQKFMRLCNCVLYYTHHTMNRNFC